MSYLTGRNGMRSLAVLLVLALVSPAVAKPHPDKADRADKDAPADNGRPKIIAERVVAVVNDAIILESELEARMLPLLSELTSVADPSERDRRLGKIRGQTLDDMINEELVVQAGEQAKIDVEPSEIQAALDEIKAQNNIDDAGLLQLLAAQGFTLGNYKTDLRRQILRLRTINSIVAPKVNISDDDALARYNELQRRSQAVGKVRLAHILIALPEHPTEQDIADAKAKAAAAKARVDAGEDWNAVCADVSEDTSTKASGGELGWFERGSLQDPAWEKVVFSMEKGDVRGPVPGDNGFHVFKAEETQSSGLKAFAEMKEQIKGELRHREMEKQTQVWIEELRKRAYIDLKQQS
jgi:parvulin-like peptidyl-prolyl isomerase